MPDQMTSNQIARYMTATKLVEFLDKLKLAPENVYAHIHAKSDADKSGRKQTSCIGITMLDYSKGKGDNTVRAKLNISPEYAERLLNVVSCNTKEYTYEETKIFGEPDKNGKSHVTKLLIKRAEVGSDGKPRNFPWYIQCENGTGISVKNAKTGGTYMKSGSYEMTAKCFVNLTDDDLFMLLTRVVHYIKAWEHTYAPKLISGGRNSRQEQIKAIQQQNANQNPPAA